MKHWLVALASVVARLADAEPIERISFSDAVKRAIAQNPDRRIALDEIARADGLLLQATSALLPQLAAMAAYTRLEGDRFINMIRADAANSLLADVAVTAPIVDFHAIAERHRARDQVGVTSANADSTKRDVAIATARAYFMAYTTSRELDITTHARDNAKGHFDYTRQRYEARVGNNLDVKRAEAELATDEADVAAALTAKKRAEEALGVITGSDHPLAAAGEPDLGVPHEGSGIASRADVIASMRAHQAAVWSAEHDWWDWLPSLRLAGDGFFTAPEIQPVPRWGYDLALTLSVPLYDGGFRRGAHEQHVAVQAEAAERDAATDRQAESDVRVSRVAVDDTQRAREAAKRAADASEQALDLAFTGYKAGTATSLEVIDAQRTALDAATRALLADDDYHQAELDLLAATGAFPGDALH